MPFSGQDQIFAEAVTRLRAAAEEDRTFDAAQMQLINLPEIIRNAGAHWARLKDKIRTGSVAFLKGCLGDNDIVLPAGDGFLIIFAEGDPDTLKERAIEMRHLLLEFYLGEEELKRLHINVTHRELNSRDLKALATPSATKPAQAPVAQHAAMFAPIWSVQAQLVASYLCVPFQDGAAPRYFYDKDFADTGTLGHRDYIDVDLALLDIVETAMNRYGVDEARPVIGISVHSTTLQNRGARAAFLERLVRIPPEHLKHAFIRIAEIEAGAPLINLADWAGLLRARVKNIALEFHASEKHAPNLAQVGVWGAGYVSPRSVDIAADIVAQVRQFRRWGDSLTRQRLRFMLGNVDRPGLIRLADEAGAAFLTSPHYWPFEKWPGTIFAAPPPQSTPQSAAQGSLSAGG
jgi:hypothetical protein